MLQNLKPWVKQNPILTIHVLFIISIIIKCFFILPFEGPIIFWDEVLYKKNAFALFNLSYNTQHYPPFYSLLIAPATLFGDNFYIVMKFINVLISSAIVYPTYLLSNIFIKKENTIVISLLALAIPYQITYPKLLMSEVLFYPLFLLSIYTFLQFLFKNNYKWGIIAGITLATCLLTRYMAVILLPAYFSTYIVYALFDYNSTFNKKRIIQLMLFVIVFLAILSLYYIPYFEYFLNRSGKYVASRNNKVESPAFHGFIWSILYISYAIVLIAPVIPAFVYSIPHFIKSRKTNPKQFAFFFLVIILSFLFIFVAIRHSQKELYEKHYILGRYIMYIFLPIIIVSFIKIENMLKLKVGKKTLLIFTGLVLTIVSFLALSGGLFKVAPHLLLSHISPESYIIKKYSILSLIFLCGIFGSLLFQRKQYFFYILILSFLTITFLSEPILNKWVQYETKMLEFVKNKKNITLYKDKYTGITFKALAFLGKHEDIQFEIMNNSNILKQKGDFSKEGYALSIGKIKKKKEIFHFTFKDKEIFVYKTPFKNSNIQKAGISDLKIKNCGFGGKLKNAIWISCQGHNEQTRVFINNIKVKSTFYEDHFTVNIPQEIIKEQSYQIRIESNNNSSSFNIRRK